MWGNIFSGAMSLAQGDSPEEILKKQAMASMTAGMTGGATPGVDSASSFAPHLAQTGAEQATSNLAQQGVFGGMSDALGGVGDKLSEYGTAVNDFTGMEAKDWTQLGIQGGTSALQGTPQQPIQAAPMGQGISRPQVDLSQSSGSLLSSNPMTSGAGGQQLTLEELKMLQQKGLL